MDTLRTVRSTLRRCVRSFSRSSAAPERLVLDELLYMAGKTLSMQDLLVAVPREVCRMLRLTHFQIFLRNGARYVPVPMPKDSSLRSISFPASCSTMGNLKRELRPVTVQASAPQPWMMLATGEEIDALQRLHAQLLVPLHGRTGLVGFAAVARGPGDFSLSDRRQLQSLGEQIGPGLETAQFQKSLSDEAVRAAEANRELELAREVQERLLPQVLPDVPGLEIGRIYRSAAQVGGDYYDVFSAGNSVCVVIADVSGKGIPAALLMATLRASLRSLMLRMDTLPELVAELNHLLYQASSASRYATFAVMVYAPTTATLTYVNAGHNAPLLFRRGGSLERLTCGGTVLGLLPNAAYEQGVLTLEAGDTLILYTDGVTEQTDADGAEWGEDGLIEAKRGTPASSAIEAAENTLHAVDEFAGKTTQADDVTLLVLRRNDEADPAPGL